MFLCNFARKAETLRVLPFKLTRLTPIYIMRPLAYKIIILFVLLTATLCAAVGFVVHSARLASGLSAVERGVAVQRQATDRLMYALLQSGTLAEGAALRYANNEALAAYLQSVENADSALSQLRSTVSDTLQQERLDTLHQLVRLRSQSVVSLVDALRRENGKGSPLQQQIEELRSGRKPFKVAAEVKADVVERGEEVVIHSRKKGFFRRLGDAFRRGKDDTVSVRTTTREHPAEQAARAQVNLSDTLADILTDVHRHVKAREQQGNRRIALHSDALRQTSARLSRRMVATLSTFSEAQRQQLAQASEQDLADRRSAAWQMGFLALLSTGVALALFVWVWRDMRQAHRYRRALEEANEHTQALMKRREQLLLTISHDIKAPVNTILGYLALIRSSQAADPAEPLAAIGASARHLLQLVTALLDYHKLEAGQVSAKMQPVNLTPLLHEVGQAFRPLAEQKNLQLQLDIHLPEGRSTYRTDAFRLRQIVENLLSNAIKYTRQGHVALHADEHNGRLRVSVSDTGCGLSQADAERIFTPFTRVKGSEGQEGTGLGLSITLQLAQLLGGEITVTSTPGQGSTFVLNLPAVHCAPLAETSVHPDAQTATPTVSNEVGNAAEENVPAAKEETTPSVAGAAATSSVQEGQPSTEAVEASRQPERAAQPTAPTGDSHLLIYVLDDDTLQLRLTMAMLHNVAPDGTVIRPFGEADSLFDCLAHGPYPHLLLTDIEMPGLTGFEVRRRVNALPGCEHLPVVAMTSHTLLSPDHFTHQGFARVLFKPFTQNDLRELLDSLVEIDGKQSNEPPVSDETPSDASASPFAPLLTFAAGDREAERSILQQFSTDCQQHAARLSQALEAHDKAALCQTAHKMLPTFTLIHSSAVAALRRLEARRGEAGWTDADTRDAHEALTAAHQTAQQLNTILAQ